jgi:hypothetical protein
MDILIRFFFLAFSGINFMVRFRLYLSDNGVIKESNKDVLPDQDKYFPTIGTLLPTPNALLLTRMIGQNWFRLYSLAFTSLSTFLTNESSMPNAMISFGPCLRSMY